MCYQITLYVFKYVKIMLFWSCCDLPLNKKKEHDFFFLEKCGLFLTSQTKRVRVWMSIWWFLLGILFSSSFLNFYAEFWSAEICQIQTTDKFCPMPCLKEKKKSRYLQKSMQYSYNPCYKMPKAQTSFSF